MDKKLKIGIDLHGVSDAFPTFFAEMTRLFVQNNAEVHIMTGELVTPQLHAQIEACGLKYTHLYSISQHHADNGTPMTFDAKGTPWIDQDLWVRAKGNYAKEHGLDIVFDDTESYGQYFSTPFMFCKGVHKEVIENSSNK